MTETILPFIKLCHSTNMYKYKIAMMRNGKRQNYGKNKISKKWKNQKIKIMAKKIKIQKLDKKIILWYGKK